MHLVTPQVTVSGGSYDVAGGALGTPTGHVAELISARIAGAGGGACIGNGGSGVSTPSAYEYPATSSTANNGKAGMSLVTNADPTSLF